MNTQYLLLWLESPLQSWGSDSKFGRRDTLNFPSRSGILGLLLCAMGASGEQHELLEKLGKYSQTVYSFSMGQREPLLCDFQMVGSGYDDTDPWSSLLIPKTAEGKKAVGGGTKMTYRYYLQDARFGVILDLPDDLVECVGTAMSNPVFDIYLGRKNCVPTDFIYRGFYQTADDALIELNRIADEKGLDQDFKVINGDSPGEGDVMTLNDIPVQFGPVKKYRDRHVTVIQG